MAEEPKVQVDLQGEDDEDVQVDFNKLGKKKKKKKKDPKNKDKAKVTAAEESSKYTKPNQPIFSNNPSLCSYRSFQLEH